MDAHHPKVAAFPAAKQAPSVDIDRVLEVSAAQFAELGFEGVSMREISRECGCPAPSIYYHFTSKSNLYKEALAQKIEESNDVMSARLAEVKDPRGRFDAMVQAFYDLFTGDRTLLLLMQRDVIDAAVTRRSFLSRPQYEHFTSLIRRTASEMSGQLIGRETAFAIGALIFGFCELSLMVHEIYDRHGPEVMGAERSRLVAAARALVTVG